MCSPFFLFYFHFTDSFERQRGPKERKVNPPLLVSPPVQHSAGLVLFLFLVYIRERKLVLGFERFQWGVFLFLFAKRKKEKKKKRHWLFVSKGPSLRTLYSFLFLNEEENGNEPTKLLVRHTTAGEVCLCIACPLDVFFRFKFYFAPSSPDLTRLS